MASVDLRHITKQYPGLKALDDVTLTVAPGEFFTLLGPSGCGKTTLLRTIAGFNTHDTGEILFDDKRIDTVPAHERNIGMVYQDYAIFPHKSVAGNVAFGLSIRNVPKAEADRRVAEALDVVQLGGLAARMPHELSGGQQQRVALARAMVINPRILLMDEPLSNLDAKLRIELREDIRDLQRSLGITTIYVTHDQEEALVISDRICVMEKGRVHQVASPLEVYGRPATQFVGTFVGTMNLIEGVAVGPGGAITVAGSAGALPRLAGRARVNLGIRPEDLIVVGQEPMHGPAFEFDATVEKVTYAGREAFCRVEAAGGLRLLVHLYRPDPSRLPQRGAVLRLAMPAGPLHAFDPGSGERIGGDA